MNVFKSKGVTLVELIVFIVVVSIALATLLRVFNQNIVDSVDPVVRIRAVEKAQALLDEILSRKFDENTPTGGMPACGTTGADACLGISPDTDFDDVGDYHNFSDTSDSSFVLDVAVINAGLDLGIANDQARLISVTVTYPVSRTLTLSAYRVNF